MTNLQIINLREGTKVKIKKDVDCADSYKKCGLLSFYNSNKKGYTEVNVDTGELDFTYPFGIEVNGGVCYQFPAECYELF